MEHREQVGPLEEGAGGEELLVRVRVRLRLRLRVRLSGEELLRGDEGYAQHVAEEHDLVRVRVRVRARARARARARVRANPKPSPKPGSMTSITRHRWKTSVSIDSTETDCWPALGGGEVVRARI